MRATTPKSRHVLAVLWAAGAFGGCAPSAEEPAPATSAGAEQASASEDEMADAKAFVTRWQRLADAYDPAIAELYADNAELVTVRTGPDGGTQKQRLSGAELKQLLPQALELAKMRGDAFSFGELRYTAQGELVEVRGTRRSKLKCYEDPDYALWLRADAQTGYKIVRELSHTQSLSSCPDQDPAPMIDAVVEATEGRLPMQLDEETRLDAVQGDADRLTYRMSLVHASAGDIDVDQLTAALRQMLVAQACLRPAIRAILDNGASLTYAFSWSDGSEALSLTFTERDCP